MAATPRDAGLPAFCRVAGVLTPVAGSIGLARSLAAAVWLERAVPGGRQSRLGRYRSAMPRWPRALAAGYAAASTDTGTSRQRCIVRAGTARKVVDSGYRAVHRHDRDRKAADPQPLRKSRAVRLLERLLAWRTARPGRSAALPRRLRRHRRRRSGQQPDRSLLPRRRSRAPCTEAKEARFRQTKFPLIHRAVAARLRSSRRHRRRRAGGSASHASSIQRLACTERMATATA